MSTFESIGAEMDERDKEMLFDVLGRCAFARFKDPNVLITREFIENILLEYRVKESRLQSVCDQIFLLYRAEGPVAGADGESYAFILKSFEEFFLARHLA